MASTCRRRSRVRSGRRSWTGEKRATVDPAQLDRWPKGAGVGSRAGRSGWW
ncbi:hypothetical protein QJS66_22970 [Kocuria rhizophila]|nr:hypothetical protein QJS66_22970 [Kocuria rhizophila]